MDYKLFSISTLCAILVLMNISSLAADSCPRGNPRDTIYQRRDQNRCEGINPSIRTNAGINLTSLATHRISDPVGDTMNIQVPRLSGLTDPIVTVRSQIRRYELDNLVLRKEPSQFTFSWSTYVLKQAKVPVKALRALASVNQGSQLVLIPVTIGKTSGQYEFVLHSNTPVKIRTFQIRRLNGQVIYTGPSRSSQGGEIIIAWDGRKNDKSIVPKGRYKLNISVEVEKYGKPPELDNINPHFEHDPNWLR